MSGSPHARPANWTAVVMVAGLIGLVATRAGAHPIHASSTQVQWSGDKRALAITVRFFTDDTNVMAEGSRIITMLAFFYPTFCCVEVLSSAMRGCGRSVMPTVLTLFGTCLLRLALLFFVTFPHLNNWTIALCYPATWLTTSVLFVIYYYNLDMKLMRSVVMPFLNKHYDSVKREHQI